MNNIFFCCKETNDLYKAFLNSGYQVIICENTDDLMKKAKDNSFAFILSDSYPVKTVEITKSFLESANEKNLKLYIEYPKEVYGLTFLPEKTFTHERLVVSDNFFDNLPYGTILMGNDVTYLPCNIKEKVHLVGARVAGYDKLAFDMPQEKEPLLFNLNENVLIATTCFSNFVTGRFSPKNSWINFFKGITNWLSKGKICPEINITQTVRPTYKKDDKLPNSYEIESADRNYNWFLEHAISQEEIGLGVLEGFGSAIKYNGYQTMRSVMRCDCIMESALVFALNSVVYDNPKAKEIFNELMDYGFSKDFYVDDPQKAEFGFLDWFRKRKVYYGDDNARAILAALCARSVTKENKWDEKILRCILANLRVCNEDGFTIHFHTPETLKDLQDGKAVNVNLVPRPHFQCYIWAMFLWAYELTGYEKLLTTAKRGIKVTMDAFPNGWKWTNSLTAEIARMVLPLSLLVKVEDTKEHREWLKKITDALLENMTECGAIKDKFGDIKMGTYPPPQSNEDYGTAEASIIQSNNDPATDLLYTTNWAFLGLHEAGYVTNDPYIKECEDKLAKFLARIQIKSEAHPELDGAWLRSFDYEKWEVFGSGADAFWGAWCVETGWTNSWISSCFYLRNLSRPLMTTEAKENFMKIAPEIIKDMMKV